MTPPATQRAAPDAAASTERETAERGRGGGVKSFFAELPVLMLVAFVLAVILKTFLLQAFWIPSESMVPTLEVNDRVLVNKLAYRFGEPERGDIVVFSDPATSGPGGLTGLWQSLTSGFGLTPPGEEDFIKRIIGLPGETVEIRDGRVYVNSQPIHESLATDGGYLGGANDDFGPVRVPQDQYFVMGDNRPFSADSRTLLGTIPAEHLIGRAFVLIWPLDRAEILSPPDYDIGVSMRDAIRGRVPEWAVIA